MDRKSVLILYLFVLFSTHFHITGSSVINSMFKQGYISPFDDVGLSPNLRLNIIHGAQMAIDTCRAAFKWERWNCSEMFLRRQNKNSLTREAAYVNAIITAGIIHTITKNCSLGHLEGCSCSTNFTKTTKIIQKIDGDAMYSNNKIDWTWSGCSDDVNFAEQVFKRHLGVSEDSNDAHAFIERHNNNIGRMVVRNSLITKCQCHTISNNCNYKTCWLSLLPFDKIADKIKNYYQRAIQVNFHDVQNGLNFGNSAHYFKRNETIRNNLKRLIYLSESPNYCVPNTNGWPGTLGRQCSRPGSRNATRSEKQSCYNLCKSCGYKVKKEEKKVSTNCNCTFVWCCKVHCDVCSEIVTDFFCV